MTRLFTSESVTEGHPDKLCDRISDSILDAYLTEDPHARVAVETITSTGFILITGEVSSIANIDIKNIARETIRDTGYTSSDIGFDADTCTIMISLDEQSPEIAGGVSHAQDNQEDQGAGDQGLMFGYATNETEELLPLPILVAHSLARKLAQVRKENIVDGLRPDGKTQVTFEYDHDGNPTRVETIVISTQHDPDKTLEELTEDLIREVITPVLKDTLPENITHDDYTLLINPGGTFIVGGPVGDAGLTGRKIIVDTYGGMARHGGGCFSGKDPSKTDRSAAYAARWVAKNIVAAGLADKAEVQISYAIGRSTPVGLFVETFGTAHYGLTDDDIQNAVSQVFDLRPAAIIEQLDLLQPIYAQTAAYGHFGRADIHLPWENTNKTTELIAAAQLNQAGKALLV